MSETIKKLSVTEISQLNICLDYAVQVLTNERRRERTGGTFCIRNNIGSVLFLNRHGTASEEKFALYDFFAQEKTLRLVRRPDDRLSAESSNPEIERHQGGVRYTNTLVGALSGFSPEEDEATSLWVGIKLEWLSEEEANELAALSDNPNYRHLFKLFEQKLLLGS